MVMGPFKSQPGGLPLMVTMTEPLPPGSDTGAFASALGVALTTAGAPALTALRARTSKLTAVPLAKPETLQGEAVHAVGAPFAVTSYLVMALPPSLDGESRRYGHCRRPAWR